MTAPALSRESAEYLLGYMRDEMLACSDKRAARAVAELERYIDGLGRPARYTLRNDGDAWQVGANDGLLVRPRSGEILAGLAALEIAVAFPGDPVRLGAFLQPGFEFKSELGSAKKMLTAARAWIADEADVGLADLLKAVTVTTNEDGLAVAICSPLPASVVTSYTAP